MPLIDLISQRLSPGPMQIRVFVLDTGSPIASELIELLSPGDLAEVDTLRMAQDRRDAAAMRGLLRFGACVLTGASPTEIDLSRDQLGRPTLAGIDRREADLNVSRTRGWAALAVSRGIRCGIDIERVDRSCLDPRLISFLAKENSTFDGLGEESDEFFDRFTGLESVLKADGRGFSEGPGAAKLIRITRNGPQNWFCGDEYWTSSAIQTPPGVVGRVAGDQRGARVVDVAPESLGVCNAH